MDYSLFFKYQPLLVQFANSIRGRSYLQIPEDAKRIIRIGHNFYTEIHDLGFKSTFQTRSFYAEKLYIALDSLEIIQENRRLNESDFSEALLHTLYLVPTFKLPFVYHTVTTITSDTGDGRISFDASATWAGARGAATGTTVAGDADAFNYSGESGGLFYIARLYYPFDTSAIPDTDTITDATLDLTTSAYTQEGTFHVVKSLVVGNATLLAADFDAIEFTSGGNRTWTSTAQRLSITLNATALGWINKTGYTNLATIGSYDQTNTTPSSGQVNSVRFWLSNYGTDADRPKLVVTHAAAAGGVTKRALSLLGIG